MREQNSVGRLLDRDGLWLSVVAALGALFLVEMVSMNAVPVARDVQLFFLPHKKILWSALQRGEIPLWTPLIRTGHPVLANFQSGVFYPPHWLYGVLPLLPAFNLLVVLHLVLGGVGAYLLLRHLSLERPAALMGAVSFILGGYLVSLTNLVNHLQAAAWAPMMALVLLRHVQQWRAATFLQGLAVYLFAFLAGAPQTFVLGAVAAMLVGLVHRPEGFGRSAVPAWRTVLTLTALAVAVAGLAAVQLLPTLEMVEQSSRAGGLSLSEAGHYSLSPLHLVHVLLPNSFGDPVYRYGHRMQLSGSAPWLYSVYLGVGALALAWHARWDRGRRRLVLLWAAMAVAGIVLALGRHLPVFPWLHAHVPGLASFRYPEKFYLLTGLAVPMLAAHGTSALLDDPPLDGLDRGAALVVLSAGLAVKVAWVTVPDRIHGLLRSASPDADALEHFGFAYVQWGQELELVLGMLAVVVALLLCHRKGWLRSKIVIPLLVVAVTADLWVAHRGVNPTVDPSFYRQEPRLLEQVPGDELRTTHRWHATPIDERAGAYYDFQLPTLSAKWFWQHTMQPNTAALWGVLGHDASDAIHLNSVTLRNMLFEELPAERRVRLLRLASVSHVYSALPQSELENSTLERMDSIPGVVHALEDPLPRAYLAHGRRFESEVDALNAALDPSTDYHREVAILGPEAAGEEGGADRIREELPGAADSVGDATSPEQEEVLSDPGSATLTEDAGETVRVDVDPDEASFLVLTDTWYPGWEAYVDGSRRPVRRANFFFRAVRVRPGDQEVVFRFRPASLRTGGIVSGGSAILLVVGLAGWTWWRRRDGDILSDREE